MLLRSSRKASALTKESSLVGSTAKLLGKAVGGASGLVGRTAVKHPVGSLATVAGVGGAATHALPQIQKGRQGMNQQYMQARRWGYAPPVTPRAGSAWRSQ